MKNMVTFIAALSLMFSAAPVNALCAAETASVSVSSAADNSVADIKAFAGKWTHQVSEGNNTVDKSAKNVGTVEINADFTYKYTDAEGKTSAGTVKLGTDKIDGTEFTVLSFYEGSALKYTAYSLTGTDVLSLGNGGLARFVKEAETTASISSFTGKWTHQVSEGNNTVDKSSKNAGTVEINADSTYKYTDTEGKTSAGTIKLGTDKIEGTEFTVLSFYEGSALKYTAYSAAGSDVLSLGNGGLARFVKEAESAAYSLGDVNNDNVINAIDASNILSHYAMSSTSKGGSFTEAQVKAADVNSDGSVNSVDASCVLSYYAYNSTVKTQAVSFEKYLTAFNEG
ncbi:MAG: hypothetical protein IKN66_06425 [Ruminococcus sp.]|nr:hypothetical protein [Ruminococcus sp.]